MKALGTIWRRECATIRQLENTLYGVLKPLAIVMLAGISLIFTSLFMALGVILCAVSGALMCAMFAWMIVLQRNPHKDIRCPYCTNVNQVFTAAASFDCDICSRTVVFDEYGHAVPADGSFDNLKPKSAFDVSEP